MVIKELIKKDKREAMIPDRRHKKGGLQDGGITNREAMIPDRQVRNDVIEELKWEPIINSAGIAVAVYGGTVSLNGAVDTYPQKQVAVQAAKRVKGVKSVVEDIHVQSPEHQMIADEVILEAAIYLLHWHTEIPAGRILVTVQDGHLTMDGHVEWQYQKDAAYETVKSIAGIKNVSNFLFIQPKANAVLVEADIERALQRKADLHECHIEVEVMGNRAALSGEVRTWTERQIAEYTTWSSPGVAEVINRLRICF